MSIQAQGVLVRTSGGETIALRAFSDSIIEVRATALAALPERKSFMVVEENAQDCEVSSGETGAAFWMATPKVRAEVDKASGQVSFFDASGKRIVREVAGSRSMKPVVEMGEATYRVTQRFHYDQVQVLMGLGGHQDGIANYKGKDCSLVQYNCIDIVPFHVTDAGWAMLWDNDSITRFGDPRVHEDLGKVFDLYNEKGEKGGLTARYFGDTMFAYTMCKREEQAVQYQFIPDKQKVPAGFNIDKGSVRWEGYIEARTAGVHKMRSFGSHYIKVTIDGVVHVDKWRQNWMLGRTFSSWTWPPARSTTS
jgi:alpha-D-xyloside xylohydrolase